MQLDRLLIPIDWYTRLRALYSAYLWHPLSQPHRELWEWADGIRRDTAPPPFVAIWPRGRGKSTHAELLAADLGVTGRRTYCMYVCATQDQADKHVATVAAIFESARVAAYNPAVARPKLGHNGSRSWNRRIMRTDAGYTVEAIGLNKAVRGQKIDWARPDVIILDDIDERHDTPATVRRKREIITSSILPAGSDNAAVLFVQNLIHSGSIAAELVKRPDEQGGARYLTRRIVSGPYPAVDGLAYEMEQDGSAIRWGITAGRSLWQGFDLAVCERELNTVGPDAYERESQHNIHADNPNALLRSDVLEATRVSAHPDLERIVVGVDPAGGAGSCGIVAVGSATVDGVRHGYTIADMSTPHGTPSAEWGRAVLRCYHETRADVIVVERNFGGDMARQVIRSARYVANDGAVVDGAAVPIVEVSASRGKAVRAQPVAALFQQGRLHHVGYYPTLERQWTAWEPGTKPSPDALDAEVWAVTYLGIVDGGFRVGW